MSRAALTYGDRHVAPRTFAGFSPDAPIEGFYRTRMRSGGVPVGVRVWYGAPLDPVTGEEMDRAPRWQAAVNGEYVELDRVWPRCAADPISETEHDYLAAMQKWGREHAPDSPQANPTQRINALTAPTPF